MGRQLWNPKHGTKFALQLRQSDQPEQPVESDQPPFVDAIPAKNGIWGFENAYKVDKAALHGFTRAELVDLGALVATNEETNVLPNNLKNELHPAFSIDKWETAVPTHFTRKHIFPLGPDSNGQPRPGNYTANNLVVWKALLPCLRLASKFLEYAHIFPWYHAFLHSEVCPITNITPEASKLATPLRKLRLPIKLDMTNPDMMGATHTRIFDISRSIRLGISDGNVDPTGNNPELKVNYNGVALPPWEDKPKNCRIYIAYQIIEHLLEDEVGSSTRLALQFHVALTLLHEFAHVLAFAKNDTNGSKLYLEDERISEAGLSFEMNIFGGHPVLLLQHSDTPDYNGPLQAGFLLEDWLGTAKGYQWTKPLSGTDADWNDREWREARSIPISFLEELGQEDFWRCFVDRWGAEALQIYPWTEGRLVKRSGHALKTQIYSTPEQNRAWLMAAKQVSRRNLGPLTSDEMIAVRIANRRISREKEINVLVITRRKLEEQKKQAQCQKTPPLEITPESDPETDEPQRDIPAAVASITLEDERPWDARVRDIDRMKEELVTHQFECDEDGERVDEFLQRNDQETVEYYATRKALWKRNKSQLHKFRKLIKDAFNSELLDGYEGMLKSYYNMKTEIGRHSRPTSEDREVRAGEQEVEDRCQALLRRASACRDRKEHGMCCGYCHQIFQQNGLSQSLRARANHICGLSTSDLQWKIWYLMEAIRLYRLMEHDYGADGPPKRLIDYRTHAEWMLADAEKIREAAEAAATGKAQAKVAQPGPKAIKHIQPSTPPKIPLYSKTTKSIQFGSPPETPIQPIAPKTTHIDTRKTTPKTFTDFDNPPGTFPTLPINLDPAPKGMSIVDVFKHRRTHKVINTAKQNFINGDYDLAEKGFLELLRLESTSEWQKARCQVFLSSIQRRTDRLQRAQTALDMYRGFLENAPEDERCIRVVEEAEALVARVKKEILCRRSAENNLARAPLVSNGLRDEHTGKPNTRAELGTIAEDGENESGLVPLETPPKKEEEELFDIVASVFNKVTAILGLKRKREENDDGGNVRSNKRLR